MQNKTAFADGVLDTLRNAKIVGVRAGADHRYTHIWCVVVEDRLFVRSWNDKRTGWFRAFRRQPDGWVRVAHREIAVRAKLARGDRLRKTVTAALGEKYTTKASRKWAAGFAKPARELTTLELVAR